MKNDSVHVARNGTILGSFDREKLADLLDTGRFLPTDHFYDTEKDAWFPLSALSQSDVPPVPAPAAPPPPTDTAQPRSSSRSGSRGSSKRARSKAKKKTESTLAGWIACLFAFGVAAGLWAYAQSLDERRQAAEDKLVELNQTVTNLRRENQLLTEVTPPGRIRGIITYEPSANQVAIMSGATVGLYRRDDVERALAKAVEPGDLSSGEGFDRAVERLKSAISSPLEISLTDSNGRLDLTVPQPGRYVLVASAAKSGPGGPERYFWLIGFQAGTQPSGLVLMNENNAISVRKPEFRISDVRPLTTGVDEQAPLP